MSFTAARRSREGGSFQRLAVLFPYLSNGSGPAAANPPAGGGRALNGKSVCSARVALTSSFGAFKWLTGGAAMLRLSGGELRAEGPTARTLTSCDRANSGGAI